MDSKLTKEMKFEDKIGVQLPLGFDKSGRLVSGTLSNRE